MISPPLTVGMPIVYADGTMSDQLHQLMLTLSLSNPIFGAGSPEGVVLARQWQLYIDTTGTTGSMEYRKKFPSIAGDPKQGWVAV